MNTYLPNGTWIVDTDAVDSHQSEKCLLKRTPAPPFLPGFILVFDAHTSPRCFLQNSNCWDTVLSSVKHLEAYTDKTFGDSLNPLLLSIQPSALDGSHRLLKTIEYLGLNPSIVSNFSSNTHEYIFVLQLYKKFLEDFCSLVGKINDFDLEKIVNKVMDSSQRRRDTDFDVLDLWNVIESYRKLYKERCEAEFPDNVLYQLQLAVEAASNKWEPKGSPEAVTSYWVGKASIIIRSTVMGCGHNFDGTGIAISRDPFSGQHTIQGVISERASGKNISIADLFTLEKQLFDEIIITSNVLEKEFLSVQQFEFIVDNGNVWVTKSRNAHQTASASLKSYVEMVSAGLLNEQDVINQMLPDNFRNLLLPHFDEFRRPSKSLTTGVGLAPGVGTGKIALNCESAEKFMRENHPVILILPEVGPEDMQVVVAAKGVITMRGGATSHPAVVSRGLGIPFIVIRDSSVSIDAENKIFKVDTVDLQQGEYISIDGGTGEIFNGEIPTIIENISENECASKILKWAGNLRKIKIFTNADTPEEASLARSLGAEGIGLCRVEHMFLGKMRMPLIQEMICYGYAARFKLAFLQKAEIDMNKWGNSMGSTAMYLDAKREVEENEAAQNYLNSLDKMRLLLQCDLEEIFSVMRGLPVTIRLIDPPLHEFLPSLEEIMLENKLEQDEDERVRKQFILETAKALHEVNPMLGLRGVRLYVLFPEIVKFQVNAILSAALMNKKRGILVNPEIMIPFVSDVREVIYTKHLIQQTATEVFNILGDRIDYKIGTMIEVPRAVMTADKLAKHVDFFSFGTNDLTQLTFGFSRDDAEAKFFQEYIDHGILAQNPFQEIDSEGVTQMILYAIKKGRETNPKLTIGICGEQGGDPATIIKLKDVGIDYMSCSPLRVPVASLMAAKSSQFHKDR